jgi:hypothetical protein
MFSQRLQDRLGGPFRIPNDASSLNALLPDLGVFVPGISLLKPTGSNPVPETAITEESELRKVSQMILPTLLPITGKSKSFISWLGMPLGAILTRSSQLEFGSSKLV